jgi:precorrin-6B methylase 2
MTSDQHDAPRHPITPRPYAAVEIIKSLRSLSTWHAMRTHFATQVDWNASRQKQRSEAFGRALPWWSYGCTHFLQQVVAPNARVLEFGSGASTSWWLERGNTVVSLESSAEWAASVRKRCAMHADRHELHVVDFRADDAAAVVNGTFDVIVIDNEGPRNERVPTAIQHIDAEGLIIFDNADRSSYAAAMSALDDYGFKRLDFFGLGPINAHATVTSIFTKEPTIKLKGLAQDFGTIEY